MLNDIIQNEISTIEVLQQKLVIPLQNWNVLSNEIILRFQMYIPADNFADTPWSCRF